MRAYLLAAVLLAVVTACVERPRQEPASPEQLTLVRRSLNPGYQIRRAYAVAGRRGAQSYLVTAYVYGPGLEEDFPITWHMPGPKHAPQPGLIQSRVPVGVDVLCCWGSTPRF